KDDGSEVPRLIPAPQYQGRQLDVVPWNLSLSPDGNWVVVGSATGKADGSVVVYPVSGGSPKLICEACEQAPDFERGPSRPYVNWSADGKFFYLNFQGSIYAISLRPGQALPPIPASGFRTKQEVAAFPGARLIPEPEAITGPD